MMDIADIEKILIDLFSQTYPKINVEISSSPSIGKMLVQSSTINLRQFIDFAVKDYSVHDIYFNHEYAQPIKNFFSISKIKEQNLNIIQTFLDTFNSNVNFNQTFQLVNNIQTRNVLRSYKKADVIRLPFMTEHAGLSNFICKNTRIFYRFRVYNHFKLSRTGKFFPIPIIHFFEDCPQPKLFAFNIYEQTIYKVTQQSFYFEDFFEINTLFNPDTDVDMLVNAYIDDQLTNTITDVSVKESIISIPLSDLTKKVELTRMLFI